MHTCTVHEAEYLKWLFHETGSRYECWRGVIGKSISRWYRKMRFECVKHGETHALSKAYLIQRLFYLHSIVALKLFRFNIEWLKGDILMISNLPNYFLGLIKLIYLSDWVKMCTYLCRYRTWDPTSTTGLTQKDSRTQV